jgi:tetratricopeptide (TPR) repeat protein
MPTPATRREAQAAPGGRPADRAAVALWVTLALLALARAALAFVPSMWAWSLNLQRFLPPAVGWALWAVAALALIPWIARPVTPLLASAGDAVAAGRAGIVIVLAAGAALLVAAFPDRVWFVGDFLLRQYTLEGRPTDVAAWYPHALPLDLFLHDTLGRALMGVGLSANGAGRALGALDAALLAALALAFARALRLRGAAAFAAAGIVFWGGWLTLLTGYNKAFAELPLVVAAVAVTGIALVREGRRPLAFALALAVGFVLHRSALGLLPAAALALVLWSRAHPGAWRKPAALASLALPAVALALMLPRILAIIARIDPMHFTPDEVRQAGGVLPGLVLGTRLVDLANLVPMLSPLALAVPPMAVLLGRPRAGWAEGALLLALATPFVGAMPFIHPGQGYYRDWDDFAAAGMTMSLGTAWLVARTLEQGPRHAWLALAAVLGAGAPSAMWLVHHRDVERGLARVETFLREEPPRAPMEQARAWDYLGWRLTDLGRFDRAADAFAREADLQPSPRVMRQWAATEALRGDPRRSQEIYRRMLTRFPDMSRAWFELARLSYELGDLAEARRAAGELQRLTPGPAASALVAHIDSLIGSREAGRGQ